MGEGDRARGLDPIDPARLMRLVARRLSDRRVGKRRRQWLRAGVVEAGQWSPTPMGAPHGGVRSPVVAPRALPGLAMDWAQQSGSLGHLTRSADAMRLVGRPRTAAAHALDAVTQVVQTLPRTGPPTKTRLVDVQSAGWECLGFHWPTGRARRSGKLFPRMWPGQKAMKAIRSPRREQPERRGLQETLPARVAPLTPILRGWRPSVRVGTSPQTFQDLDREARPRVGPWRRAHRKGATPPAPLQGRLSTSGLAYGSARGLCGTRPCKLQEGGGRKAV